MTEDTSMKRKKTDGSRRHGRIRFYAQAAPDAENAGHQRDRAFLPAAAQADLLDWFKGHDRPPAPAGKALEFAKPAEWQANLTLTPEDKVAGYNNFMNSASIKPIRRRTRVACAPILDAHHRWRSGETSDP